MNSLRQIPTLNTAGWSVLDYEVAYDGLVAIDHATLGVTNQPRGEEGKELIRGAHFLAEVMTEWVHWRLTDLVTELQAIRFASPDEDDRRVRLLLKHQLEYSDMTVAELVQLALQQSVKRG